MSDEITRILNDGKPKEKPIKRELEEADPMFDILTEYQKRKEEEAEFLKPLPIQPTESELIDKDKTILIVQSHVRLLVKKYGLRCSYEIFDKINKEVERIIKRAVWRCNKSSYSKRPRKSLMVWDI